jgi:hypothetical protein
MSAININEINSIGIQAQGRIDGITEVELIGTNGKTGDAKFTAYWFGGVRVIETNGEPVWEEQDPCAFAEMMGEILSAMFGALDNAKKYLDHLQSIDGLPNQGTNPNK